MIGSKILAINKNRLPCMIHIFIHPRVSSKCEIGFPLH